MEESLAAPVALYFLYALGLASLAAGALFLLWLLFMILAPGLHGRWTKMENSLWVRLGLLGPEWADRLARFEQGPWMKLIYGLEGLLLVALGFGLLAIYAHFAPLQP